MDKLVDKTYDLETILKQYLWELGLEVKKIETETMENDQYERGFIITAFKQRYPFPFLKRERAE